MSGYRAGLDLGQVSDFSALVIVLRGRPNDKAGNPLPVTKPHYYVEFAQRWKGTSYPALVGQVATILSHPEVVERGISLTVDATGVGKPVIDMFRDARNAGMLPCRPLPVVISAGEKVNEQVVESKGTISVPKKDLMGHLEVLLSTGRLHIAERLKLLPTLVEELKNFRAKITESGHARFEAARSGHDDLVLALALACWEGGHVGAGFMEAWSGMANQNPVERIPQSVRGEVPSATSPMYVDPSNYSRGGN